jgi:hypothetical protein
MSGAAQQSTRSGIGFAGLLTLVFVIAKLMGAVTWPWWLVFLPIYILPLVVLAIMAAVLAVAGVGWALVWLFSLVAPYFYRAYRKVRG